MSQHLFTAPAKTGESLRIICGYDRPLNHFFLSITPVLEQTHQHREDLHYESLYERGGGFNQAHQVISKLQEFHIAYPRPLLVRLEDDVEADYEAFRNHQSRNSITHWPLPPLEAARNEAYVDVLRLQQLLSQDQVSTDEELVALLKGELVVFNDEQRLRQLIAQERNNLLVDDEHVIDFEKYFPGVVSYDDDVTANG